MKVTDIKQQQRRKDRYSIYIDGKYSFALSESGLLSSRISIGQELESHELEELKKFSAEDKAVYRVLDLISRRPRSRGEIRDYLRLKKYSEEEIEKTLNTLSDKGYIDDEDFAKRWVDSRRLLKPISNRKLRLELIQKRVDSEIIQRVLEEDDTDEIETIRKLIAKKQKQTRYQDNQKLMQFLIRQGFNYSDIKTAMEREPGESEPADG